MADRSGQQLGNYQLIRLLGRGGFAEVYLAKHTYLNTNAAIKILHLRLAVGDEESFLTEARIIGSLVHPHIVRVLDFGIADNTPYLVMDYAPNGTLRQRHPRGAILPLLTIVSYSRQIAEALQYAHSRKLIHRDIKPENLLLGANNEILLSDFGTALLVQTVHNESLHEMAGTVTYMAPEQIQGKPRPASDQYGLAVMVYEWLCGECPFRGSFVELFSQHMTAKPPSLRAKIPSIPADVEQVVMTALAKDPAQRFGSVKAFANALEQACLVEQPTISAAPYVPSSQPLPPAEVPSEQNRPDSVSFTTLDQSNSDVYNTAILPPSSPEKSRDSVLYLSSPRSPGQTPGAVPTGENAQPAITPVLSSTGVQMPSAPPAPTSKKGQISRRSVVLGLAGVAVVAVAAGGSIIYLPQLFKQTKNVVKQHLPTATPAPNTIGQPILFTYHGHTGAINGIDWSPDGTRVVSGGNDFSVQVWNMSGSTPLFLYRHAQVVKAAAWSPNGKYIASASKDKTIQVRDAGSGKLLHTITANKGPVNAVSWSPDSKTIVSAGSDKEVKVWDALTGNNAMMLYHDLSPVNTVAWSPNGKYIASGGGDHVVKVWDVMAGKIIYTFNQHTDAIRSIAWSPDSKYIVSGSNDQTARAWEATSGRVMWSYPEPLGVVHSVTWSPDGQFIAVGSNNGYIRALDAAGGQQAFFHDGQTGSINALAWSSSGAQIVSGSSDKTAQVWKAM
ncbi:MAG TPA: serine/threonine-protein kinase [Ktedonobacteraceae bacterium]|jgi:WD40 repeat protein|nr:serine/threonine-protein kinase [Ktedonobacteraceae bacterium]